MALSVLSDRRDNRIYLAICLLNTSEKYPTRVHLSDGGEAVVHKWYFIVKAHKDTPCPDSSI